MSDGAGSFVLDGLEPGSKVHLAVWKDGYRPLDHRDAEVTERGATVELTLEREGSAEPR